MARRTGDVRRSESRRSGKVPDLKPLPRRQLIDQTTATQQALGSGPTLVPKVAGRPAMLADQPPRKAASFSALGIRGRTGPPLADPAPHRGNGIPFEPCLQRGTRWSWPTPWAADPWKSPWAASTAGPAAGAAAPTADRAWPCLPRPYPRCAPGPLRAPGRHRPPG